ncbi:MAG: sulfotransferase [Pseudomonadota bacterium]
MTDSPSPDSKEAIAAALQAARQYVRAGELITAEDTLKELRSQHPKNADIAAFLGEVLRRQRKLTAATAVLQAALKKKKKHVAARYYLGLVEAMQGDDSAAMITLNAVLDRAPEHVGALHNLGVLHDRAGQYEQAEHFYRRALAQQPGNVPTQRNLASLLLDHGSHDESRALYAQIIGANGMDVDAHFAYSRLTRYQPDDSTLPALEKLNKPVESMHWTRQVKFCFTVGKANHDIGRYDAAFGAFEVGNRVHAQHRPFDTTNHFALQEDVRRVFDDAFFARFQPLLEDDAAPIFIVGMPRTGSTLIEQMLTAHSQVTSTGEVPYLSQAVQTQLIGKRETFSNAMPQWTQSMLENAAEAYLRSLERQNPTGYSRIVDKTPGNYTFIGLIHTLFPHATIIHTVRHPLATIWSNYATLFREGHRFAYDLPTLTRYYEDYARTMDHWREVLPANAIVDLVYEELVQAPETTLRPLLETMGLAFEPQCLEFYHQKRKVRSASVADVRRPLYETSIAQWQHYAAQLDDTARALGLSSPKE